MNSEESENAAFKSKPRRFWRRSDIKRFLVVWGEFIPKLQKTRKNGHNHEAIAARLRKEGVLATAKEVHTKIHNFTQRFRRERRQLQSSGDTSTWLFYDDVEKIIGSLKYNAVIKDVPNLNTESCSNSEKFNSSQSTRSNQNLIEVDTASVPRVYDVPIRVPENERTTIISAASTSAPNIETDLYTPSTSRFDIGDGAHLLSSFTESNTKYRRLMRKMHRRKFRDDLLDELRKNNSLLQMQLNEDRKFHREMLSINTRRLVLDEREAQIKEKMAKQQDERMKKNSEFLENNLNVLEVLLRQKKK